MLGEEAGHFVRTQPEVFLSCALVQHRFVLPVGLLFEKVGVSAFVLDQLGVSALFEEFAAFDDKNAIGFA